MSERRFNFTRTRIDHLVPPEKGKRQYYYDAGMPHLALCITGKGTRSFYLYRKVDGRPERIFIGRFPGTTVDQARNAAEQYNGQIAASENPQAAKRAARTELTLEELFQKYLKQHIRARGMQTKNPESYYRRYFVPWGPRKLSRIKRTEVQNLHAEIAAKRSGASANKATALLRAMFNRALYWGDFEGENPGAHIDRFPERSRDRFLHPDEMPRFFQALAYESNPTFRDFVLLALLTGARRGNLQAMRWADINRERATWRIPKTKSGEPHTVPLAPEALAILKLRAEEAQTEWVFPGTGKTGHLTEMRRAWKSLLQRAEIEDLRIHDLRRTLGSWQAATGASLPIIGKTLAHKNVSTTAIYARLSLDPVRKAVNTAARAMFAAGGVADTGSGELIQGDGHEGKH